MGLDILPGRKSPPPDAHTTEDSDTLRTACIPWCIFVSEEEDKCSQEDRWAKGVARKDDWWKVSGQ